MFADYQGQFCFPEPYYTGRFLLFIFIDAQVYAGSQFVEIERHFALRIKSLCITQIVHQFCKPRSHFIRVRCRIILIIFPLLNILLYELTFTHKNTTFIYKYNVSPNIMLTVKLDTGFNIEIDFPISPFHRRMFAWCIDALVLFLYGLLCSKFIELLPQKKLTENQWLYILVGLPVLFYYPLMEILTNGQTIGKKILGIRVITLEGGQASISQYIIRWVFRLADFPVWICGAIATGSLPWYCSVLAFSGIACVIISDKSQRIGDMVAGTIVIFTRSKTSWQDTVFTELEADYKPRYPQVMQMSDKDINSLKMIIETIKRNNNHDLAFRIAERIKWKLNLQADQDSKDFLETLLKDYNYYSSH